VNFQISESDYPIAQARLQREGRQGWRWVVDACPLPGCAVKRHFHGGGDLEDDPRHFLGHRAHLGSLLGYVLVDIDPARTASIVDSWRQAAAVRQTGPTPRR
jgi:hypothetical protein